MSRDEILKTFKELAKSQGFYGRLLASLEDAKESSPEAYEKFLTNLEAHNFSGPVDLILYLEC